MLDWLDDVGPYVVVAIMLGGLAAALTIVGAVVGIIGAWAVQ